MQHDTITVPEVAKMLRLSRQTIYNFVRDGKIPAFKIGTKVRFHRADIEAMMKAPKPEQQPEQGENQ